MHMHLVTVHRSEKCTEKVIIVLSSHLAPSIRLSHQISYFISCSPATLRNPKEQKESLLGRLHSPSLLGTLPSHSPRLARSSVGHRRKDIFVFRFRSDHLHRPNGQISV